MSKEVADLLRRARARIEDPKNWCQRALARTAADVLVLPEHPLATRWCALGSLDAESGVYLGDEYDSIHERALNALMRASNHEFIDWNDGPDGHARVLAAYDEAIRQEERDDE